MHVRQATETLPLPPTPVAVLSLVEQCAPGVDGPIPDAQGRIRHQELTRLMSRRVGRRARERPAVSSKGPSGMVEEHSGPSVRELAFHPGQSVKHPIFGKGTVVSSKVSGDDEEVTVAFEGRGVKRLLSSYAKLEAL